MEEIWKSVVGYEGIYEVSNIGRVMSHHNKRHDMNLIMKQKIDKYGYPCIKLSNHGKSKYVTVHRLVGEAFIENPDELPMINHIDEDKTNNRVENLEWCTAQYNNTYGHRLEKAFPKSWEKWSFTEAGRQHMSKVGKSRRKKCAAYKNGELVKEFESTAEAGKYFGVVSSAVSCCCSHRTKTCKGMTWEYI